MIEVRNFQKTFRSGLRGKRVHAVHDVSFEVEAGEVFGFLGPNGAGKTTTIKALLGLIRPDGGRLRLLGEPSDSSAWRGRVGFMPEHTHFYEYLTALELVTWFGRLTGLVRHDAERQAREALERVGLGHALRRRLRGFSKGMLQRAGLAQAMMGSPQLLILDEPMTGLDPIGRKFMRELIVELAAEGRTVFYSTHILPDVELTCRRVAIVDKGRTVRTGALDDILGESTRSVTVELTGLPDQGLDGFEGRFAQSGPHTWAAEFDDEAEARRALAAAVAAGAVVRKFEPHRQDLESLFVRALGEAQEGIPA